MAAVASCWALLLGILVATYLRPASGLCPGCDANETVLKEVPAAPITVSELLQADPEDLYDVVRLQIPMPADDLPVVLNSTHKITVRGKGSAIPARLLQMPWPRSPPWNDGYLDAFQPGLPSRPPPSPPPPPPPPPSGGPWYTIIDGADLVYQSVVIRLDEGASLTLASMAFYFFELFRNGVAGKALSDLSFVPVEVSAGATLHLEDVTLVLECYALDSLLRTLCQNPDAWPYDPKVEIGDKVMHIANWTSTASGPDFGVPRRAGGQVHWVNVTLTCPASSRPKIQPCAARAVADGRELQEAARKALVDESADTVILSITDDVVLPVDGSWEQVPLEPGQQLVLRGDPARRTTLDLSGIAEAWNLLPLQPKEEDDSVFFGYFSRTLGSSRNTEPGAQSVALLYDLFIVNLPLPIRSDGPMSLLAVSLPCFGIVRGVQYDGFPQLQVIRGTIVVPDLEAEFLAGAAVSNSSDLWPGQPLGSFNITLMPDEAYPEPSNMKNAARLGLQQLRLLSEVSLSNCTLLSASGYEQLPGAAPLRNQSRLWLPALLATRDPDTVAQWGAGGLAVASGLQQALTSLASCGSQPDFNPIKLIWGPADDHSIPTLNSSFVSSSSNGAIIGLSNDGDAPAANTCIVDGGPTHSSSPELQPFLPGGGGRVFSDLQGAIGRFSLLRPITLRNLVLYNLAPGGAYPSDVAAAASGGGVPLSPPPLHPSDAAWENSSLPLWLFNFSRSYCQDPGYQQAPQLGAVPPEAALLVLENVTLVVSEREWRALVAAVLQKHAPKALAEAQQGRILQQQPAPAPARRMLEEQQPQPPWLPTPATYPPSPATPAPPSQPTTPFPQLPPWMPWLPTPYAAPLPPHTPPSPPSPPPPPPAPPYATTTREALLGFAAASRVMSYNYNTGDLVLAVARHYGWRGTNVTIRYKLPPDAPAGAKLLSYPDSMLPYGDLADILIDLQLKFSTDNEDPQQLTTAVTESPSPASLPTNPHSSAPPPTSSPSPHGRTRWKISLVESLSAVAGAVLLVLLVAGAVYAARRWRRNRNGSERDPRREAGGELQEVTGKGPEVTVHCYSKGSQLLEGGPAGGGDPPSSMETGRASRSGGGPPTRSVESDLDIAAKLPDTHPQTSVALPSGDESSCPEARPCGGGSSVAEVIHSAMVRALGASSSRTYYSAAPSVGVHGASAAVGAAAVGELPSRGGSRLVDYNPDGGGQAKGASRTAEGDEKTPGAPDLDNTTFMRALEVYFQALWLESSQHSQTTTADGSRAQGTMSAAPSSLGKASKDIPDAIQAIQAELRDPDLHLNGIIGSGSFGVVYRGVWRGLPVAVKTLVVPQSPAADNSQEGVVRQRVVLEAAISMAMSHPNVVATYSFEIKPLYESAPAGLVEDAGQPWRGVANGAMYGNAGGAAAADVNIQQHCDASKLYILQEYCNGGTIRGMLERGLAGCIRAGGLPALLALHLALDVARGMEHIHSCRIVHGDLKPENILIVYDSSPNDGKQRPAGVPQTGGGQSATPHDAFKGSPVSAVPVSESLQLKAKVADFGLSIKMPEDATHVSQHFHGTPSYLAPEVAVSGKLSPRADVWSFGLMLIELYFGCSLNGMLAACAGVLETTDPLDRPQQRPLLACVKDILAAMTDSTFAELVRSCLSQESKDRPGFTEIATALQNMYVRHLRNDGFAVGLGLPYFGG